MDAVGHDPLAVLSRLTEERNLPQEVASYGRQLMEGVTRHKQRIDDIIQSCAPAWPVSQLSHIDRNILRLAIFEILVDNSVPLKVAINEAVELAKTYSSDSAPRFINGVLGAVSKTAVAGRTSIS